MLSSCLFGSFYLCSTSLSYEDKSSTVIPRTPTLVPRFGVLANCLQYKTSNDIVAKTKRINI